MTEQDQESPGAMGIRLRQALVVLVGLVAAAVMVVLGLWQMGVYQDQSQQSAQERADQPAVQLIDVAGPGQAITDGFGRTVQFRGTYEPAFQLLVPVDGEPGRFRILSGLEQADGSVVPVIRGVITGTDAPAPPTGEVEQSGILLPSEPAAEGTLPEGQIPSVRLASLAQRWPKPLISGYVTLAASDAKEQHLVPDVADLPEGHGRLRNGAYAFQWWIFAAFAVAMSIRMARDFGARKDYDELLAGGRASSAGGRDGGDGDESDPQP